VVADGFVTPDDATKSKSSCNKIVARKNHKVGRPPAGIDLSRVAALRAEGYSLRGIADKLGVSHMTVKRVLAEHGLKLGDFIKGRV
jgi:DNA invertase Pin-like site-specific DNA recombinase